jgi:uncharacterized protein DUF7014/AbiJ-like protein
MPIVDLFSSRMKANRPAEDVWVYDSVPDKLRVQTSNIIRGALGRSQYGNYDSHSAYKFIAESVAHEHGRESLGSYAASFDEAVHQCITTERELLLWLDCVELSLRVVAKIAAELDGHGRSVAQISIPANAAIEELNERFRRAGFGYRFEDDSLIRIDNELMHQEVTLPALRLLSDPRFAGADEEFRAAHSHFKAGENKDCAVDALCAVESTMKAICDAKGWKYPKGARASDLLKVLRDKKLFPEFADQSFDQLIATLKSGLPSVRNQAGAHGQGAKPVEVPVHVAAYALNLAATKILLLVEAFHATENDDQ